MTGHVIEPGSKYAKRELRAETGGGGEGLGFSEMVALQAGKGRNSAKAKSELRTAIGAAADGYYAGEARRAADAESGYGYSEHVYASLEAMDDEKVNIDAMVSLVETLDATRAEGAVLVFMPGARAHCGERGRARWRARQGRTDKGPRVRESKKARGAHARTRARERARGSERAREEREMGRPSSPLQACLRSRRCARRSPPTAPWPHGCSCCRCTAHSRPPTSCASSTARP
eukprot:185120-Prymnesium_polylepis.1